MAEITITGPADGSMSDAVKAVAEAEERRRLEMEAEADKERQRYEKEQEAIAERIEEAEEREDMPEQQPQQFDFAAAFNQLGETLSAKLDELKPKPSEEEARAARIAELENELTTLRPADTDSGNGPATPPKKVKKTTAAKTGDDSGESGDEHTEPPKRKWYSWS